ncbi:zinc finger and BTB domain-containing protein 11-like isoform X2 [Pomacea canaliculata]|nr:zinc finger and BTB domain-containing protein 11-like isoform X2 [Pomacea canaliculata]
MAIHADLRNYKCSICSLNFRQKIHLERHIKYRHEEKKVKCPLCDYICANENPDLKVHLKRKHASQGDGTGAAAAFTCKECGIVAMSKRDLRQHAKFHTKGPELKLFCQMCSFVTDCESRLRRHMFIHTKEKPFQCGMCDYRGSQKEHVLRHMRSVHNIEIVRKHRPRKEGLTHRVGGEGETSGQRPLDKADYSSDEKIFACNHCTMKFAKLINLYKHLHTQHRDIMPAEQGSTFSCVVCDFRTSSKKNLLVHMRKHNTTDQSPPSHVYSCVLCRYMNPKRRNLFQHMRKKHHIEIILRDDGTTTCFVTNDTFSSTSVSTLQLQNPSNDVSDLVLGEVITTVSQTGSSRDDGSLETGNSAASLPAIVKMEDLAMVVSNPETAGVEGPLIVDAGPEVVEGLSAQSLSQHEAAEAIQGLQALAQHRVVETDTLVEEQVQVMGSDEQNTLVIDPSTLGVVEQLVTPKTEPLEVVEIEESQLLEDVTEATTISEDDAAMLGVPPSTISTLTEEAPDGLQLSAEQLMSLTTGDYLEINGEMYKVEVSMEENTTGSMLTHQVINILPSV